jgi:hypothetical protein
MKTFLRAAVAALSLSCIMIVLNAQTTLPPQTTPPAQAAPPPRPTPPTRDPNTPGFVTAKGLDVHDELG